MLLKKKLGNIFETIAEASAFYVLYHCLVWNDGHSMGSLMFIIQSLSGDGTKSIHCEYLMNSQAQPVHKLRTIKQLGIKY